MENYEMLRALYDFQAAHAKTISFQEGDYFVLYQTSTKQRNWWPVVNANGDIGFVPSNYVMKLKVEPNFLLNFLDCSIDSLKKRTNDDINGIIKKDELLQRLIDKRDLIEQSLDQLYSIQNNEVITSQNHDHGDNGNYIVIDNKTTDTETAVTVAATETFETFCSTAVASAVNDGGDADGDADGDIAKFLQESPSMGMLNVQQFNNSAQDLTSEISDSTHTTTVQTAKVMNNDEENSSSVTVVTNQQDDDQEDTDEKESSSVRNHYHHKEAEKSPPSSSCHNFQVVDSDSDAKIAMVANDLNNLKISVASLDVYQMIDAIRTNTNLCFDFSCEALRCVLMNLEQLFPNAISPYLESVAVHLNNKPKLPKELLGVTHDAKRLQHIFSQLAECKNDVEQRTWMLYEDEEDIVQFLEELVDILNNADECISSYEMSCDHYQSLINLVQYYQMEHRWRIKSLLIKVFTAACHLDHIVVDILLTSSLPLDIVEDIKCNFSDFEKSKELIKMLIIIFSLGQAMPVNHQDYIGVQFVKFLFDIVEESNQCDSLVNQCIALILAFNSQFNDVTQNIVIETMHDMQSAKTFTERILLLLNREEDPTKLLKHDIGEKVNSVLKMFEDMFSFPQTASLFYTNDNKVLIDILVRQLSDLSSGDPMRRHYLELCRKILRNTNYAEHTHRKQDLMKIFTSIFCEEAESSANDQQLVRDIANEFPHIFKA